MGLTARSTGTGALSGDFSVEKRSPDDKIIAFAGNPNVGKSSVFNALTGLHQHTGNWPGKTVATAQGSFKTERFSYIPVDLPGTYSLLAHSQEEEVARNFICFGGADAAVVVCDATCLERSLNLALQVTEICPKTLICVNLMDEAKRRGIKIDLKLLEKKLGVPVVGTSAHDKKTLAKFTSTLDKLCAGEIIPAPRKLHYTEAIEQAVLPVEQAIKARFGDQISPRWTALGSLGGDRSLISEIEKYYAKSSSEDHEKFDISGEISEAQKILAENNITSDQLKDKIVSCILQNAEEACAGAVISENPKSSSGTASRADKILTSRLFGYPIMLALLMVVFWITIVGANYPSELLSTGLFWLGDRLSDLMTFLNAPDWLHGILIDGAYRVLAWVVSVMLPPMAIFFPLFTLLEDLGYLPRIAYNLDKPFSKCNACGKQALTMCMGFGCNAAGIVGCRIIDSRRERLIAMLTNVFVPCNGRFPMILTIISLFFIGGTIGSGGLGGSIASAAILTGVILLGIGMTFLMSKILSVTLLKGEPSSFTLELPPFRKPQFGKILVRSLLDRTVFVLGRAVVSAAPAGVIIWLLANITIPISGGGSLLSYVTEFFDPFGKFIGMDGAIITAFLLGLPANEIVVPLIVMTYAQQGSLAEAAPAQMLELFSQNGWTWVTALCVIVFALMHFPCATSLLTIKKESGSWRWTALAFAIPTACGIVICAVIANAARLFGIC